MLINKHNLLLLFDENKAIFAELNSKLDRIKMVIVIQCTDKVGLVATIASLLQGQDLNIVSMREHVDSIQNRFFARVEINKTVDAIVLEKQLKGVLPLDAQVIVNPNPLKKIVVLVTKEYHCLSDILIRNHFNTLGAQVLAVVGNHAVLEDICNRFNMPFHLVSHEGVTKEEFEEKLVAQVNKYTVDYVILAKFMRILSPNFVQQYPLRIINIHHSFLPAFIGANPYKQAYQRGVKLIGATAHFVTNNLDEGPIIAQQIISVNHSFTTVDMVKAGKEIETSVLAHALQLVFTDKVLVYENKTVVFE